MIPLVVGIAGGSASGKSTVIKKIVEHFTIESLAVLDHDSYYKDISVYGDTPIQEVNFDHPDALDTSLLIDHIKQLKKHAFIDIPIYDFSTHRRLKETKTIQPKPVIIVDGILIFTEKKLRDLCHIKIFVDTDADERLLRRLKRDINERGRSIDSVLTQYLNFVKPSHMEFVEPSKRWADIIIPRGGENQIAIDMIITRIQKMLER